MTTIMSGGALTRVQTSGLEQRLGPTRGTVPLLGVREVELPDGRKVMVAPSATYDAMYRRQPALYAVSTLLMKAIARLPLPTYERTADGNRQRVRGIGPAIPLKRPYRRGSSWDLKIRLAYDLLIHGKHLQIKKRRHPAEPPIGLQPTNWWRVETIYDDDGILGFVVYGGGAPDGRIPTAMSYGPNRVIVPIQDAVYYEMPGGGVSPVEVLRRRLAIQEASLDYQGSSLKNGVTPRAAFAFKNGIHPNDRDFVRAELEKLYAGPDAGGRFAMLTADATMSSVGVSAVDIALIDQIRLGNEECCAAYGVSPSIAGFSADKVATFASQQEFHKQLYVDALGPILTMIEETLQAQFIDEEPAWDGYFVEFLLDELLKPDLFQRMQAYLLAMNSGTSTIDDRQRMENRPAFNIKGVTDVPLIPVNMRPAAPGMFDVPPDPSNAASTDGSAHERLVRDAMNARST